MYFTKLGSETVHWLTDQTYPERATGDKILLFSRLALGHIQTPIH